MSERHDPTPAALYARVSSERQDVDLSVSAQLRALRDYADKNGYVVARPHVDVHCNAIDTKNCGTRGQWTWKRLGVTVTRLPASNVPTAQATSSLDVTVARAGDSYDSAYVQ